MNACQEGAGVSGKEGRAGEGASGGPGRRGLGRGMGLHWALRFEPGKGGGRAVAGVQGAGGGPHCTGTLSPAAAALLSATALYPPVPSSHPNPPRCYRVSRYIVYLSYEGVFI
jgi:hypothetical protein